MNNHKILVIEDEKEIRKFIYNTLEIEGYKVIEADSVKEGIRSATLYRPSLIILDMELKDGQGQEIVKSVRSWTNNIPIIIVSVRSDTEDIIAMLKLGANDYMTKPFDPRELIVRVMANIRDKFIKEDKKDLSVIKVEDLVVDLVKSIVTIKNNKVKFTPKEYELLKLLVINRGKLLTHKYILDEVWGKGYGENDEYLRIYIKNIRNKIRQYSLREYIITEIGLGYRFLE